MTRLRRAVGRRGAEGAESAPKLPLSLVLDNLRSCYNVGSVFRTAETAGLREVRAIQPSARSVSRMGERGARGWGGLVSQSDLLPKARPEVCDLLLKVVTCGITPHPPDNMKLRKAGPGAANPPCCPAVDPLPPQDFAAATSASAPVQRALTRAPPAAQTAFTAADLVPTRHFDSTLAAVHALQARHPLRPCPRRRMRSVAVRAAASPRSCRFGESGGAGAAALRRRVRVLTGAVRRAAGGRTGVCDGDCGGGCVLQRRRVSARLCARAGQRGRSRAEPPRPARPGLTRGRGERCRAFLRT